MSRFAGYYLVYLCTFAEAGGDLRFPDLVVSIYKAFYALAH